MGKSSKKQVSSESDQTDGSGSEVESLDDEKHSSLLQAMDALDDKKKKKASLRSEAYGMSEYHLPSAKDEVSLQELVGALHQTTTHGTLKKQLQRVKKKAKVLPVPLSKPEQERVHRSLAYEATTKELSKWDSIVHKNRSAEQIKFPQEQPDLRLLTSPGDLIKRTQPRTSLELEVAALLKGSQNVLEEDKVLTPAEERALQAMSVEEAKARRAELQKYRALLSYKEAKARRQGKIKSKRYHRILQKEKKKQEKNSLDELEKADPEAYMEKLKRLDEDRIEERISLKHRGGSKFAQKQALYKKYDGQTREAFQEMLQKSRQLTKKVAMETDSSDEEKSDNKQHQEPVPSAADPDSKNPWMSSGIKVSRRITKPEPVTNDTQESSDEDENSDSREVVEAESCEDEEAPQEDIDIDVLFDKLEQKSVHTVRQIKKKEREIAGKTEDSDDEDEDDDDEENLLLLNAEEDEKERRLLENRVSKERKLLVAGDAGHSKIGMSLKRKKTLEDFDGSDVEDSEEELEDDQHGNPPGNTKVSLARGKQTEAEKQSDSGPVVDPKKFMTIGSKSQKPTITEVDTDDEAEEDQVEDQSMTIAEAFACDDVVDEFQQEKAEISERDKPKDIDLTLPGWGDWGGEGIKPSKRKKKRFTIKAAPAPPRKDRNLTNVIISETKDKSITKHQVADLPFPFSNPSQFESSIRQPIGKTWNPETAYKKMIKPKTVTRQGTVIPPMDRETMFKKQKTEKLEIDVESKHLKKRKSKKHKKLH